MAVGWIMLHRKILKSQVFARADLLKLFTLCLLKANFEDGWMPVEGLTTPVPVKRGQFITGRDALHFEYYQGKKRPSNKSPLTIWRWLEKLNEIGLLNVETNNRYSLVTVLKYSIYQQPHFESEQQNEQQGAKSEQQNEQQLNTSKKNKEVLQEENNSSIVEIDERDLDSQEVARIARLLAKVAPAKSHADRDVIRRWACLRVANRIPEDFLAGVIDAIGKRKGGRPDNPMAFFVRTTQDKCRRACPRLNWGRLMRTVRLRDEHQLPANGTPGATQIPVKFRSANS